eukprot:jgi/Botrbrau1/23017/Bobra.136_1s0009.1
MIALALMRGRAPRSTASAEARSPRNGARARSPAGARPRPTPRPSHASSKGGEEALKERRTWLEGSSRTASAISLLAAEVLSFEAAREGKAMPQEFTFAPTTNLAGYPELMERVRVLASSLTAADAQVAMLTAQQHVVERGAGSCGETAVGRAGGDLRHQLVELKETVARVESIATGVEGAQSLQGLLRGCQEAVHKLMNFLDADLGAVAKLGSLLADSDRDPGPMAQQALPSFLQPFSRAELQAAAIVTFVAGQPPRSHGRHPRRHGGCGTGACTAEYRLAGADGLCRRCGSVHCSGVFGEAQCGLGGDRARGLPKLHISESTQRSFAKETQGTGTAAGTPAGGVLPEQARETQYERAGLLPGTRENPGPSRLMFGVGLEGIVPEGPGPTEPARGTGRTSGPPGPPGGTNTRRLKELARFKERAVNGVVSKLKGDIVFREGTKDPVPVKDQADGLIRQATNLDALSRMYEGWCAWV